MTMRDGSAQTSVVIRDLKTNVGNRLKQDAEMVEPTDLAKWDTII